MTKARDRIRKIASDRISPYTGNYVPPERELKVSNSRYDAKYLLLFFYVILALVLIFGSIR